MRFAPGPFDRMVLGIAASLVLLIAGVVALGDHVGAAVSAVFPAEGAHPAVTTALRIVFAQAMDSSSVETHFAIDPPVGGHARWEGNTFVFQPTRALLPETLYTATLGADAASIFGQHTLRTMRWNFTPRLPAVLYLSMTAPDTFSLWRAGLDGGVPRKLFAPADGVLSYAPSPDGEQIALAEFRGRAGADLWLGDADGQNARKLLDCAPGSCSGMEWSPDGKLLAYERQELAVTGQLGATRTWLVDIASGKTSPATSDNQVLGFSPLWSADGSRLAFYDPSVAGIRVLNRAGGQLDTISTPSGLVGTFSPDAKAMVYVNARPEDNQGRTELWIDWLDIKDGSGPLLSQSADDRAPAWSPDGAWIAFARRELDPQAGFGSQLILQHVASGKLRTLTHETGYDNSDFRWDPTARRILVQRLGLHVGDLASGLWVYDLDTDTFSSLVNGGLQGRWLP
jgi:dipeptidyl aminopeptidase/acylaminoacyl peptidase